MRILIVDDSVNMLAQLRSDLEEGGAAVTEASSGEQALAIVARDANFDLILTDMNMPGLDGLALATRLRENAALSTTPIFVLSAERSPDIKKRAREARITAWIVKPYVKETLLAAISRLDLRAA